MGKVIIKLFKKWEQEKKRNQMNYKLKAIWTNRSLRIFYKDKQLQTIDKIIIKLFNLNNELLIKKTKN